jgi:hypothetical protein
MRTSDRRSWSSTYRLSSESRQQRILRAFHRLDDPGITALGTSKGGEFLVVLDCSSARAEIHARRVVLTLDLLAERVGTEKPTPDLYEAGKPTSAYIAGIGLDVPRRLVRLVLRR